MVLSLFPSHYSSLLDTPFDRFVAADPFVLSVFGPDLSHHDRADPRRRCAPRADAHSSSASRSVRTVLASSYTSHHTEDATVVTVDLPGVAKEHVTVEVDGRKLTVSGRRCRRVDTPAPASAESDDVAMDTRHPTAANAGDQPAPAANDSRPDNAPDTAAPVDDPNSNNHTNSQPEHTPKPTPTHDSTNDVMYRTVIRLGPTIDADAIVAERMQDGVLTLRLPHRKHPEPRRLSVQ